MTSVKKKINTSKLFIHLFLILGVVFMILPFAWMLLTSFKIKYLTKQNHVNN